MNEILMRINDLSVSYRHENEQVLSDVSLELHKGEIIGIVGESGCGKTSLLKSVISPKYHDMVIQGGELWYKKENLLQITEKRRKELLGNEIGFIVQNSISSLNPIRRIRAQIRELLKEKEGLGRTEADKRAETFLKRMKCPPDTMYRYPFQLSGGQRQRTLIAMTMMLHPKVLLADEPTTALDVTIQAELLKQLKELASEYETGILLITHNMGVVASIADRICVMYHGRIVEMGATECILTNPCHPYTRALLRSIPDMQQPKEEPLYCIPDGKKPLSENGCVFADRCSECLECCKSEQPPEKLLERGWYVCFH